MVYDLFQSSYLNFQQMFYIEKSGSKIPPHNISQGEKRIPVDRGIPLYSRTQKTLPCVFYPFAFAMPVTWAVTVPSTVKPPVTAHLGARRPSQYFFADVLSFLNVSFWGYAGKKCHYA